MMVVVFSIAVGLISGLVGGWLGCRSAPKIPELRLRAVLAQARHLAIILLCPLCLMVLAPLLEGNAEWQWSLPFWLQVYDELLLRMLCCCCTNYVLGFLAGLYLGHRHEQRLRIVLLALFLGIFLPFASTSRRPPPIRLSEVRESADHQVLQSTPYTCVPAALANILRDQGLPATEAELAAALRTTAAGSSLAEAAREMERRGFAVRKITVTNHDSSQLHAPALLVVDSGTHVLAYWGISNNLAQITDPMSGRKALSLLRFSQRWTGRALEFKRMKANPAQGSAAPRR